MDPYIQRLEASDSALNVYKDGALVFFSKSKGV